MNKCTLLLSHKFVKGKGLVACVKTELHA